MQEPLAQCPDAPLVGSRSLKLLGRSRKAAGLQRCRASGSKAISLVGRSARPSSQSQYSGKMYCFRGRDGSGSHRTWGETVKLFGPNCYPNEKRRFPSPGGGQPPVRTKGTCPCGPAGPPLRAQSRVQQGGGWVWKGQKENTRRHD